MEVSDFVKTIEGRTTLLVPQSSVVSKVPPKVPAFFNPAAKLNRDLSVLAYGAYAPSLGARTFADSLAGIGARALRVAVEVPGIEQVYVNDINSVAIEAATKAAELNSVSNKCTFSVEEVCRFLLKGPNGEKRFGIVDLDPFGTPARHVDCVLRAILDGGLVSVTATDTAVLCGVYPKVCVRRYYGSPLNNSYGNEVAVRLLTSLLALTASRLELAIHPVFVHVTMHYVRVYATVAVSSSQANDVFSNVGYILHCFRCRHRESVQDHSKTDKCQLCGSNIRVGGQLWTGKLYNKDFVNKMLVKDSDKQCKKVLQAAAEEISEIPYYFRADEISAKMKTNPHPIPRILERLKSAGFAASRTAMNPGAFKTDARLDQILYVLR